VKIFLDIAPRAQLPAGIERFAALDDEVELVVRSHHSKGGSAERAGNRKRACADQDIAA